MAPLIAQTDDRQRAGQHQMVRSDHIRFFKTDDAEQQQTGANERRRARRPSDDLRDGQAVMKNARVHNRAVDLGPGVSDGTGSEAAVQIRGGEVFTFGFDLREYGQVPRPPTG